MASPELETLERGISDGTGETSRCPAATPARRMERRISHMACHVSPVMATRINRCWTEASPCAINISLSQTSSFWVPYQSLLVAWQMGTLAFHGRVRDRRWEFGLRRPVCKAAEFQATNGNCASRGQLPPTKPRPFTPYQPVHLRVASDRNIKLPYPL